METLPDDCLVNILSKLSLKDMSPILRVCKLWKNIVEMDVMRSIAKHICDGVFKNLELDGNLWYPFVRFIIDIQKPAEKEDNKTDDYGTDNKTYDSDIECDIPKINTLSDTFYHVLKNGRDEFVKPLISAGVDVNAEIDFIVPLRLAVGFDHIGIVKILLDNGANIDAQNHYGDTALKYSRNEKMTEYLFERGAKVYPEILYEIHYFCPNHLSEVIRCLLKHGLNIDGIFHHAYNDCTELSNSCDYGNYELAKALVDCGADVDIPDSNGKFPINRAVSSGKLGLIELLHNAGANINQKDSQGMTPLIYLSNVKKSLPHGVKNKNVINTNAIKMRVISESDIQIAEKLIDMGADINAQDNLGKTALMYACNRGNTRVVKKLLDAGADISIVDKHGNSVYWYAKISHKDTIVKMLPKK